MTWSSVPKQIPGTEPLFALLDGLAVHAAMRPEQTSAEGLLAVLNHHLDKITVTESAQSTDHQSPVRDPINKRGR
jgi:hypothetical protein